MSPFALENLRSKLAGRRWNGERADDPAAAVATILRAGAEGAEVLLIERAERVGDPWSGHVAFPGGKRDARDASVLETSLRETEEEVGLRLGAEALVARLEDVRARSNGYRVAQFVFALADRDATLVPNAEVASTMWVPLARIESRQGEETMPWPVGDTLVQLPCVRVGSLLLWGMTYKMVWQVIEAAK